MAGSLVSLFAALLVVIAMRRTQTALLGEVRKLRASADEALWSLRESRHFAALHQQITQGCLDDVHRLLGMKAIDWPDREEERQKYFDLYRAQQGPQD